MVSGRLDKPGLWAEAMSSASAAARVLAWTKDRATLLGAMTLS